MCSQLGVRGPNDGSRCASKSFEAKEFFLLLLSNVLSLANNILIYANVCGDWGWDMNLHFLPSMFNRLNTQVFMKNS